MGQKKKPIKNVKVIDYKKCWADLKEFNQTTKRISELKGQDVSGSDAVKELIEQIENKNTTFKVEQ